MKAVREKSSGTIAIGRIMMKIVCTADRENRNGLKGPGARVKNIEKGDLARSGCENIFGDSVSHWRVASQIIRW